MRGFLVVTIVGSLGLVACHPVAHVAIDSGGVPVVTAMADAQFGDLRRTLDEVAASHREARLRLAATTDDERIELSTHDNDDLEDLVVIRVTKNDTLVGGRSTTTDDDIRASAASNSQSASRFAVVRVDDDARVADVMRATRVAKGGGFSHTILSRRRPGMRTPIHPRDRAAASIGCPWPSRGPRGPVAAAKALVEVTRDAAGVGHVRVLNAPAGGFRQAAAFCASTAELPPGAQTDAMQLEVEFEVGNYVQCATPGDDLVSVGMYAPTGNTRYGATPSSACDRFTR